MNHKTSKQFLSKTYLDLRIGSRPGLAAQRMHGCAILPPKHQCVQYYPLYHKLPLIGRARIEYPDFWKYS